jgi:hypothetical protein
MTQPKIQALGGASNKVQRIIGQNYFLKSDINFIRQFFYKTDFKPISKRQFKTAEVMRILIYVMLFQSSDIFHMEFVPS